MSNPNKIHSGQFDNIFGVIESEIEEIHDAFSGMSEAEYDKLFLSIIRKEPALTEDQELVFNTNGVARRAKEIILQCSESDPKFGLDRIFGKEVPRPEIMKLIAVKCIILVLINLGVKLADAKNPSLDGTANLRYAYATARENSLEKYQFELELELQSQPFAEFKTAYQQAYNAQFFKNPFSAMKRMLANGTVNSIEQVRAYAVSHPGTRTAKILERLDLGFEQSEPTTSIRSSNI